MAVLPDISPTSDPMSWVTQSLNGDPEVLVLVWDVVVASVVVVVVAVVVVSMGSGCTAPKTRTASIRHRPAVLSASPARIRMVMGDSESCTELIASECVLKSVSSGTATVVAVVNPSTLVRNWKDLGPLRSRCSRNCILLIESRLPVAGETVNSK